MKRPLLLVCMAFIAGLLLHTHFRLAAAPVVALAAVCAVVWLGLRRRMDSTGADWILALVLVAALGVFRATLSTHERESGFDAVQQAQSFGTETVVGRVVDVHRRSAPRVQFDLAQATAEGSGPFVVLPGLVQVSVNGSAPIVPRFGDVVHVQGQLVPVGPGMLPHEQGYFDYLAGRGVAAQVEVDAATDMRVLRRGSAPLWEWPLLVPRRLRAAVGERFDALLSPEVAGVLRAMLLAERDAVPDDLVEAFQATGLAHLLALSGLHVTALVAAVFWFGRRFHVRRKRRALATILFALFFLSMVGWRPPIVRATILGICVMLGSILERKTDGINLLALSAFLQLLLQPLLLHQLGFQLSHLIVLFLILAHSAAEPLLKQVRSAWLRWPAVGVLASATAWVASAPLVGNAFGAVPLAAVGANLLAVPLGSLVVMVGLVYAVPALLVPPLAAVLAPLAALPVQALALVVRGSACIPPLSVGRASAVALAFYYAAAVVLLVPARRFPRLAGERPLNKWVVFLAVLALYAVVDLLYTAPHPLRIRFLALGQGDCVLVRCPHGEFILVDGGAPTIDTERQSRLLKHLRHERVRRIHLLVNTHPQADHIGDLDRVIEKHPVDLLLVNGDRLETPKAEGFFRGVAAAGIRTATAVAGMRIDGIRDVTIEVLNPPSSEEVCFIEPNDGSVVLRLSYRRFETLLAADIEYPAEEWLLWKGVELDSDVLKVAHHGSANSSILPFLERVDPEVAVIQVGKNPYGHPTYAAIQRLRAAGAYVFTTQRDGTVEVVTDGLVYTVGAMRSPTLVRRSADRDP